MNKIAEALQNIRQIVNETLPEPVLHPFSVIGKPVVTGIDLARMPDRTVYGRPLDDHIIGAIAERFSVPMNVAIEWIAQVDVDGAIERRCTVAPAYTAEKLRDHEATISKLVGENAELMEQCDLFAAQIVRQVIEIDELRLAALDAYTEAIREQERAAAELREKGLREALERFIDDAENDSAIEDRVDTAQNGLSVLAQPRTTAAIDALLREAEAKALEGAAKEIERLRVVVTELSALAQHSDECSWITPLPIGEGYWGCNCGLDRLVLDGDPTDAAIFPTTAPLPQSR